MADYFRVYIQKNQDGANVVDTIDDFGMFCMEDSFMTCDKIKEPTKRSWAEFDGDDEYISPAGLKYEAYENTIKFGFNGSAFKANNKLASFLEYLRSSGSLRVYSEFTMIGRTDVRLKSVSQTLDRDPNNQDILTISITFKYNNPSTDIVPEKDGTGKVINLSAI